MMKDILFKIAINTLAVFIVTWMLGIQLDHAGTAILVAVTLALLNTFLRPFLLLLTFQTNTITWGICMLVVNAGLVLLAGKIVPGFHVATFWTAFWFGILMPVVAFLLGVPQKIRQQQIVFRRVTNFGDPSAFDGNAPKFGDTQDFQDAEIIEDEEITKN